MLKNRYQEILVGLNITSLIRGLVSTKRGLSTLLIDDSRFRSDTYPGGHLSEIEILALQRLGKEHDIPELLDIRKFLSPAQIEFVTNRTRLRLGQSSFDNLRELLRKFPELVDPQDLDVVYSEGEKSFHEFFLEEVSRYESTCFAAHKKTRATKFELQGPKWFKSVYQRFGEMINQEYALSRDLKYSGLLHLMGIFHEDKLKTRLNPEEIPFYFFRLLSPIWRLQDLFIITQLKRRMILEGGDYKESTVQFWQFHNGRFENLLLSSFEGVISGERVLFFNHLPVEVPFHIRSPYPFFRKTQMAPLNRPQTPFPPADMTLVTDLSQLGSERPYRSITFYGLDVASYQWPYLDMPGSKSEFYDREMEESYSKDSKQVPFEKKQVRSHGTLNVSLDLRTMRNQRKNEATPLVPLPLDIVQSDRVIQGFEYWGPFRYRSMGLLSLYYGIEGN